MFASRYELLRQVGTGGFSQVWKVADRKAFGSIVALKIFAPDKGLDSDGITQFSREYARFFGRPPRADVREILERRAGGPGISRGEPLLQS